MSALSSFAIQISGYSVRRALRGSKEVGYVKFDLGITVRHGEKRYGFWVFNCMAVRNTNGEIEWRAPKSRPMGAPQQYTAIVPTVDLYQEVLDFVKNKFADRIFIRPAPGFHEERYEEKFTINRSDENTGQWEADHPPISGSDDRNRGGERTA
ncbi:MAG: hypothetical protein V2G41_09740 [bacterium JZ-2024 1]